MLMKICNITIILVFIFSSLLHGQEAKDASDTISLDFKGMDVVDVLKLIAQRGNMNIAISKNVRGKVTMFLKDVNIYDAFEIILASNELAYEQKGTIVNVMTERDYEKLYGQTFHDKRIIETFELKYADATEVSKAVTQIKSKIGKVIVDEAANMIVVMDSPIIITGAKNIILALDKPVETRVFSLNYAKGEEVKTKLEEKITKNIGVVQVDERTNKVIVTELVSKMPSVERIIAELDERTREVLIEAKILEVTLNDEFRWGVNWDKIFKIAGKFGSFAAGANFSDAIVGTVIPAETGTTIGGSLEVGSIASHRYHSMIEILDKMGKTEVLSSPRIVVINNEEAAILVGTNHPFATTGTTVSETVSQTTQQVTYVDLGIKLHVTPTINNDGYITMKIKPEVSSKTGDVEIVSEEGTTTRTTNVPIISTSEAETTVMVKDGNTIILAGLIEKRSEEEEKKIPFLGDIPLLGNMFKSKTEGSSSNPERKELVIFLTPHIISGDTMSPEVKEYLTTTEVGKAEVVQPPKKKIKLTRLSWAEPEERVMEEIIEEEDSSVIEEALLERVTYNTSTLSPMSYYNLVRNLVLQMANENYSRSGISGDVYVSFKLSSDGRLVGNPRILAPADETLKVLAVESVEDASPFPRFPESIVSPAETFRILISYK